MAHIEEDLREMVRVVGRATGRHLTLPPHGVLFTLVKTNEYGSEGVSAYYTGNEMRAFLNGMLRGCAYGQVPVKGMD